MKYSLTLTLITSAFFLFSCNSGSNSKSEKADTNETINQTIMDTTNFFDIETSLGTITIKLYDETPKHRDNFRKLALEGYYDGILFHRVIKGFMIQTGDPYTKDPSKSDLYGTGGPEYTIPAEIMTQFTHKKGALAAARKSDMVNPKKESSGSQFYIVEDSNNCVHLDGQYTIFGETVKGLDVVDKIAAVQTGVRDIPVTPVKIISVKAAK